MSAATWVKEQWPVLVAIATLVGGTLVAGASFEAKAEAAGAAKAKGLEERLERIEHAVERIENHLMGVPSERNRPANHQ